jgi:hypothetical protein
LREIVFFIFRSSNSIFVFKSRVKIKSYSVPRGQDDGFIRGQLLYYDWESRMSFICARLVHRSTEQV